MFGRRSATKKIIIGAIINMIRKRLVMRYITWVFIAVILLVVSLFCSYYSSKQSAKELVGDSLAYCQLTQTKITIEPFEKNQIVWVFKFSRPGSYDEEFYIYTTLLGSVVATNPKDLENRLRKFEKLEVYPYPKLE
jgi:hypothetical protein